MALPQDHIDSIADALVDSEQLRLPARLSKGPVPTAEKRQYIYALLQHDPGVFLERHGRLISREQRCFFEPLRHNSYEVDFYLKLYEDEDHKLLTKGAASSTAKNRRLAKMTRLAKEGYFDEEVARKRAPLLHHHYLGQQPSSSQAQARPNTLHDQIIQQHEEQEVRARMAAQKQEEDAAGEAFEATLTESESESDEDDDKDDELVFQKYEKHEGATQDPAANLTEDEFQQNKEEFQSMMKERFLNGEDGGKDADNDSSLDDDWAKEQTQDIEDEYFET